MSRQGFWHHNRTSVMLLSECCGNFKRLRHNRAMRWRPASAGHCGLAEPDGRLSIAKDLSAFTDLSGQWIEPRSCPTPAARRPARHRLERDKELSNRDEMNRSSALFDLGAGIPCSREKIAAYSLLRQNKFPARPRREFSSPYSQEPRCLRQLDRDDPASGASRLQCRI